MGLWAYLWSNYNYDLPFGFGKLVGPIWALLLGPDGVELYHYSTSSEFDLFRVEGLQPLTFLLLACLLSVC